MRSMKRRALKMGIPIIALVGLSWWIYPKDLDLSQATSNVVKAENGQPAQLWWWRPREEPKTVFNDKTDGNKYGESYSIWASTWMVSKWLKVAYIADRPDGEVKVYLLSPPEVGKVRFYLARRSDLTRVRPLRSDPLNDETAE